MKTKYLSVLVSFGVLLSGIAGSFSAVAPAATQTVAAAKKAKVQPKGTIAFSGVTVKVIKGNMKVTTAPKGNLAQTWGGQTNLSVTDKQSTHIIGHNNTSFGKIVKLKKGSPVTVRDSKGHSKTYHVTAVRNVTDYGMIQGTKKDVWNQIVSAKQGEQVVLQTCLSKTLNRIVWAR
ncbi:sortase domain-containing protein [Lacticaseibacillus songhuajiangensis]|jgi:sortase (surface protein transpeptidase)|uniref:sortase domain-containing protein n=1 Tax=Lacticaseibacillus songhuajiangensis TaxID=1296539 RepID=UPI000F76E724|nr:sortase [Lacticaseibacillus songhuajiangensis]MCI1284278.1 sortase [Lacticaseibacillus songhuajiangensis]